MTSQQFFEQLDARIAKYDLLCHPFYEAWSKGRLTRDDLREYGCDYYAHVESFPAYLAAFSLRLDDGELRRAVLANMEDELGGKTAAGEREPSHAEMWLDFAEGMGASRNLYGSKTLLAVKKLTDWFHQIASHGTPAEALGAFYAYESQVPRVAQEKARGLREMYGANEKICAYFTLHTTADVYHSNVWKQQLAKQVEGNFEAADQALTAAESAAKALWETLDGIEEKRMSRIAA